MKYITLESITVGQYQELYRIQRSEGDDLEKAINSIAVLTGKARWEVEEMPFTEFQGMTRDIVTLFSINPVQPKVKSSLKLRGQRYHVTLDMKQIKSGQYIDFQMFIRGGLIENLHKIAACLLVPMKQYGPVKVIGKYSGEQHEQVADAVLESKFIDIHGFCVFFLDLWNNTIVLLEDYLRSELAKNPATMNLKEMDLQTIMAGFLMQNEFPILRELN